MTGFTFHRHSPSSLNLFAACREMFVLEKIMGRRQQGGAPMFRGIAVEDGVTHGLLNLEAPMQDCIDVAMAVWDTKTALNTDARNDEFRSSIPNMVKLALTELRPYGKPDQCQAEHTWHPEGLKYPIFGKSDYHWSEHNITVDLKTTGAMPSKIKEPHARQAAFYCTSNNAAGRITYCTPKKVTTYSVDNIDAHRAAYVKIARKCEAFMAQSDDPDFFVSITAPDTDSFYWSGPMRHVAYEVWGF